MTQEEYEAEQAEIESLINQINALIAENNRLIDEINNALHNIQILKNNVGVLGRNIEPKMRSVSGEVELDADKTKAVSNALQEMTEQYFTFKTLSSASKNLSQYTDEYYAKYQHYNKLRRIALGYVIGLDNNFVSDETLRKEVEKIYLQNTEYWLAYAASAVMLWASDEKEAAKRALDKAIFMDETKASLYFMLINLRFGRDKVAREWFLYYMERVDSGHLPEDWKYLLQAYLTGTFGTDPEFQKLVATRMNAMLAKEEATTVDFGKKFSSRAYQYIDTHLHTTREAFPYLKQTCADHGQMMEMLSDAEKNAVIAAWYNALAEEKDEQSGFIAQRIENVLYALVSSYDDGELEIVKKIRYNDCILTAKGDVARAQEKYELEFPPKKRTTFGDLLADWAFQEDSNLTPLLIRRFAIDLMKDWIFKGYEQFNRDNLQKEKKEYTFDIDGCEVTTSETGYERAKTRVDQFFEKNKWKSITADKFALIFMLMSVCGVLLLGIMAVTAVGAHGFGTGARIALVTGILLVLAGVFLLWRRIVEVLAALQEKKRLALQKLAHSLEELGRWRELFHKEADRISDLERAVSEFGPSAR